MHRVVVRALIAIAFTLAVSLSADAGNPQQWTDLYRVPEFDPEMCAAIAGAAECFEDYHTFVLLQVWKKNGLIKLGTNLRTPPDLGELWRPTMCVCINQDWLGCGIHLKHVVWHEGVHVRQYTPGRGPVPGEDWIGVPRPAVAGIDLALWGVGSDIVAAGALKNEMEVEILTLENFTYLQLDLDPITLKHILKKAIARYDKAKKELCKRLSSLAERISLLENMSLNATQDAQVAKMRQDLETLTKCKENLELRRTESFSDVAALTNCP